MEPLRQAVQDLPRRRSRGEGRQRGAFKLVHKEKIRQLQRQCFYSFVAGGRVKEKPQILQQQAWLNIAQFFEIALFFIPKRGYNNNNARHGVLRIIF
jgi:hypothetical protein